MSVFCNICTLFQKLMTTNFFQNPFVITLIDNSGIWFIQSQNISYNFCSSRTQKPPKSQYFTFFYCEIYISHDRITIKILNFQNNFFIPFICCIHNCLYFLPCNTCNKFFCCDIFVQKFTCHTPITHNNCSIADSHYFINKMCNIHYNFIFLL